MTRTWIAIILLVLSIATAIEIVAVKAMPAEQQIIIFGGQSSASGSGGGTTPCTSTGIFNLSNVCNDIYFIGALK